MVDDIIAYEFLVLELLQHREYERDNVSYGEAIMNPAKLAKRDLEYDKNFPYVTQEQIDAFKDLLTPELLWKDIYDMKKDFGRQIDDMFTKGEIKETFEMHIERLEREQKYPEYPPNGVDDILAFQSMFSTMVDVNSAKMDEKESTYSGTPLQNALSFQRINSDYITQEQKEKFAKQFNENTTWADVWKMNRDNDKIVREARENNEIQFDWPSEMKGR